MEEPGLTYEEMKKALNKMSAKEREITMIFYLKDIKDRLNEIESHTFEALKKS